MIWVLISSRVHNHLSARASADEHHKSYTKNSDIIAHIAFANLSKVNKDHLMTT